MPLNNFKPQKFIFIILMLILIALSFFILRPFIIAIISAAVLAYLCYPVFKIINKQIKNSTASSIITIALLTILIAIPLYYMLNALYLETKNLLQGYDYSHVLSSFSPNISSLLSEGINKAVFFFASKASELLFSLPALILIFVVLIACLFYFLKEGPELLAKIESLLPFSQKEKQFLHNEFKNVASGVMYSILLTGLMEGILGALGFYLLGISSPVLWGLIMFIFTFIPGLGTPLVWGPIGIYKLIQGDIFTGIGVLAFGIILLILIEFLLKNKIIVDKSKIHPLIVFVGALGGLKFLGFVGLILGPVILGMLIPFYRTFVLKHNKAQV